MTTISHVRVGTGEHRVIALHGWFGSARGWGTLPDYVDGNEFTYAFMDLRGYGERRAVAGDFTMEEAAADAVALADELGWERFSLIGHSMSGRAIQHVLLAVPDRVRSLVAVNPVPANATELDEDGWGLFAGAAVNPDNRTVIVNITTGSRLPAAFVEHIVAHPVDNSTPEALSAYLNSWAKGDFSDRVAGNRAAVKVIVGEHDAAISPDVVKQTWLVSYPNAQLEVIPNSGHYPMYETPAALVASIEDFLRQG